MGDTSSMNVGTRNIQMLLRITGSMDFTHRPEYKTNLQKRPSCGDEEDVYSVGSLGEI
jgi:hypothetical protein